MASPNTTTTDDAANSEDRHARDRRLATMFRADENVWMIDEEYNPVDTTWLVTLVRRGEQSQWMRQRYRYDCPSGVVYFLGARPLSDEELRILRRTWRKLPVRELQGPLDE